MININNLLFRSDFFMKRAMPWFRHIHMSTCSLLINTVHDLECKRNFKRTGKFRGRLRQNISQGIVKRNLQNLESVKPCDPSLSRFVTIHTPHYDNSRIGPQNQTCNCNVPLKPTEVTFNSFAFSDSKSCCVKQRRKICAAYNTTLAAKNMVFLW